MTFRALFSSAVKKLHLHCHSNFGQLPFLEHLIEAARNGLLTVPIFLVFLGAAPAQSPPSRPILFVHGWCGSAYEWTQLFPFLFNNLPTSLYPNQDVYLVEYNTSTSTIGFWQENNPKIGASAGVTAVIHAALCASI